jgi:uncharacterized protein YjbI with pentapeptide repeats
MTTSDADHHVWSQEEKDNLRFREVVAEEKGAKAAQDEAAAITKEAGAAVETGETQKAAVVTQKWSVKFQAFALLLASIATVAATVVAWAAVSAVRSSQRTAAQQQTEDRLQTAVTAIGDNSPAEQVAGLTLLRRSVEAQVNAALSDSSTQQDATDAYATSLEVIGVYLRITTTFGKNPSIQAVYAADELRDILELGSNLKTIDNGQTPSIDLSLVGLRDISWADVRFDWLDTAYMPWIDLRGTNLTNSKWGHATLTHAQLQCADLQGADLRLADLRSADLRGANLSGAKLPPPAMLKWVKTTRAVGPVKGLHISNPAGSYDINTCRATTPYNTVPTPPKG